MAEETHHLSRSEKLTASKDRQANVRWPIALDYRLDGLVRRANEAGDKTNRRELLAALLLNADSTADELREMLTTYRRATVGQALLGSADDDGTADVIAFQSHRPGPRTG